ncbi:hypothetical protein Q8A67_011994 [Cirrhinus molitorella]|uniref:Uncharacterized protein n=1 Tax=Cirrhinus molitorella TaxID=172907 RepID=A0AA88PRA9_9TELE|nr:hypothetical protein Q8A67_011994 [Cirrhinus molitorella]
MFSWECVSAGGNVGYPHPEELREGPDRANVTSTECCSERKLSLLTLKLRAVHLISITAQAERTRSAHGREQKAVTGEDGDAARSEREDLIKTTNINEENGVDLFRRKSRSRRCEHGIRTAG